MPKVPIWRRYLRLWGSDPEADVDDELEFHLSMRVEDLRREGLSEAEARERAEREFGNLERIRSEMNEIGEKRRRRRRQARVWESFRQDLRHAFRSAVRAPVFSGLAVATLALGIGANAAIFSVLKSVLIDALPYDDADRLVRVYGRFLDGSQERGPLSAGTVDDVRQRQRSFEEVAAFNFPRDVIHEGDDRPRVLKAIWVEPGFFRTLGVSPAVGRGFQEDDTASDTSRVVLLTDESRQRLFAGDEGAVGRELVINGIPRTVVGVLPPGFVPPEGAPDIYFALDIGPVLRSPVSARRSHWLGLVGRLEPGVDAESAEREMVDIAADLAREHPDANAGISLRALPVREAMLGDTRTPLLVLMASAGLVLLIACGNLAGAMLSRTISRRKEFALRTALGAGRGRVVRQLLTESGLLALVGGAAGLLLAVGGLAAVRELALPALPGYAELSVDRGAVLVTLLLSVATGLAFGLMPALAAGRPDVHDTLREEGRGASETTRSGRLRGMLVAGQIALSLSLLAGTGLLGRSLWAMMSAPAGFDAEGVLTATVQLPSGEYPNDEALVGFHEELAERLRAVPGVQAAASASSVPTEVVSRMGITVEGRPNPSGDQQPFVLYASVTDEYFRALRIPVVRGRTFDTRDDADAPRRMVISQSMARRFWPDSDPVGERVRMGPDLSSPWIEVIGVVGDVRNDQTLRDAEPMAYGSMRQIPWPVSVLVVRASGDPLARVEAVEGVVEAMNPRLPLDRPATLASVVGEKLVGRRLPVLLMAAFGVLALLLASLGVYAMFATMAAARKREFGVRMALGSSSRDIGRLVLRQGGVWMAVGLAGGAVGVVVISRLVRHLLYGVPHFDPLTLGAAAAAVVVCATIALLVPVRRAMRVDPATALQAQ